MTTLHWSTIAGKAAFHAARDTKTRSKPLAYHGHDFAELFWIDAGQARHRINGAHVPLQTGDLVFIRPSDCHGIDQLVSDDIKLTNIAFPRETLDFLGPRYFPRQPWAFQASGQYPVMVRIEPAQLRRLNRRADELFASPRERLYLDRFLLSLLAELGTQKQEALPDDCPDWLARACQAIREPARFSGGVEEFLRLCGRSREHVARSVRRWFGVTPTEYVNRVRIAYAQRQLAMGDQEILDIALDCGIENLSHFYDLFRTQTGMTPRAYRLAQRRSL